MKHGTLTRVAEPTSEGPYPLREGGITGMFTKPPTEDRRFAISNGQPLGDDPLNNMRLVHTSPIEYVEETEFGWRFETWSGSIYELEVHE